MDYRHKHIKKLIDTLVVPKVNEILMKAEHPIIDNVRVDEVFNEYASESPSSKNHVYIWVYYKNQPNGLDTYINHFAYPIAHMIVNCIDYVITDKYKANIMNILMDNLNTTTFRFYSDDHKFSMSYSIDELKNRVMGDW
jgi:hypothetical protein